MKKKSIVTLLSTAVGAVVVLVIVVVGNLLVSDAGWRLDMTEGRLYTLSEGTKRILGSLEAPVTVRLYATRNDNAMPVPLRVYAEKVGNLLEEYAKASDGKVVVEVLNPEPDSEAADSANLDGVRGQPVDLDTTVYLGVSFTSIDRKTAIPFLSPTREELLEYDISRSIAEVSSVDQPVVGVMSGLDVFGQPQQMAMMNPMANQSQPWIAVEELRRLFDVRQLEMGVEEIPEDIDLLLLIHPSGIQPATEFAIDQYLLGGGQVVAFLDPFSVVGGGASQNPMMPPPASASNLPNLLDAWGIGFSDKIVADAKFRTVMSSGQGAPSPVSGVLSIDSSGIDADDVVTGQMDSLLMLFAGAFSGEVREGLEMETLVESTDTATLVDRMRAEGGDVAYPEEGSPLPLAVRLSGEFRTAFPDGDPSAQNDGDGDGDGAGDAEGTEGAGEDAPEDGAGGESEPAALAKSSQAGSVMLVGDADMLFDQFAVQIQNILGQQLVIPRNANLDLLLNGVELLAGDSNLIHIRSRGSMQRPFTRVKEMEAEAEARYRDQIVRLEEELQQTQQRLGELQQTRPDGQNLILTPEQEEELRKFERRRVEVRNELKNVRRQLRKDVDALENRIKWVNIAAMPLLVVVVGVGVAVARRKRASKS